MLNSLLERRWLIVLRSNQDLSYKTARRGLAYDFANDKQSRFVQVS